MAGFAEGATLGHLEFVEEELLIGPFFDLAEVVPLLVELQRTR